MEGTAGDKVCGIAVMETKPAGMARDVSGERKGDKIGASVDHCISEMVLLIKMLSGR